MHAGLVRRGRMATVRRTASGRWDGRTPAALMCPLTKVLHGVVAAQNAAELLCLAALASHAGTVDR